MGDRLEVSKLTLTNLDCETQNSSWTLRGRSAQKEKNALKTVKHLMAQPFLTAVSIAAITHSTWAFATMFAGLEPHPQFEFAWWSWVIPGFLLAFSIDIGLLALGTRIRSGERTRSILGAFGVLCI